MCSYPLPRVIRPVQEEHMRRSRPTAQRSLFENLQTPGQVPTGEVRARLRVLLSELLCQVAAFEVARQSRPIEAKPEAPGNE